MPKPKSPNSTINTNETFEKYFEVKSHIDLPHKFVCPTVDFFDLLEMRKSCREFSALSIQDISTLFWFSSRQVGTFKGLPNRVKTPIPTAGALASVRTIILRPSEKAWLYDPIDHTVFVLSSPSITCDKIRKSANEFFDIGNGSLLLFFALRPFISEYYESPTSLVLREAGVLLGTFSLIAEAFDFSFCPLGTTAENWLYDLLGSSEQIIIPAGAAVIGRR